MVHRNNSGRNGVGILIDRSLKDGVVEVRRQGDRIILIWLVVGDSALNVISAYAPQVGLSHSTKRQFWEDLDGMVLALLKYPFYPLFILDNGMNLISKLLTILTPA